VPEHAVRAAVGLSDNGRAIFATALGGKLVSIFTLALLTLIGRE
jgi:hypothetical protein